MRPVVLALSLTLLAATFATSASALIDLPVCFPLQDDAGSGFDAPGSRGDALVLTDDGTYQGCGDRVDNRDWYTFTVAAGDKVRVTVTEDECSRIEVDLHGQGGTSWSYYGRSDRTECGAEVVGVAAQDEDMTFELNVRTLSLEGGAYTLTLERAPDLVGACGDPQDDGGTGHDASDPHVANLSGAVSTRGCLDEFDVIDWYSIPLGAGDHIEVTITPDVCGRYDVLLGGWNMSFDDDYESRENRCGAFTVEAFAFEDTSAYVEFFTFFHGTAYDLDVVITPGGA